MNYDSIIMEMLSRIQTLEQQVKELSDAQNETGGGITEAKNMTTAEIKAYIENLLAKAKAENKDSIVLVARDIHRALRLKDRFPSVCNAMRQCMNSTDEILYSPPSGHSSTLEIRYKLK